MSLVTHSFDLDITPGAIPLVVNVSEYDENRQFTVNLIDEGGVFTIPSGTTATVEGTIGNTGFSESATVSGNTITFTLTESMTAKAGDVWAKIKLVKDSKPIQTCAFILRCDRAGVEAKTVVGADGFQQQISEAVNVFLDSNPLPVDPNQIQAAVDRYLSEHGVPVPVSSVNGMTGAVVLPLARPDDPHINVFNPDASGVVMGYIASQGQINSSDSYWSTDYIPVAQGDVVRLFFGGRSKVFAYAAEYSSTSKDEFISRTANGSYSSYTVENDGYLRLSIKTSSIAWSDKSTAMITINDTNSAYVPYGEEETSDGLMSAADKKKLDGLGASAWKKVFDKFLFIAYSSFGSRAPNSVPHFEYCAQRDYDWLKADVQPTSDGGLVCCHDSGFTLDSNGRVTTYDSANATEIYTMTLAQATALTYASYTTTHVASIDDFLKVCKRYGKTPYITIRDAHMDVVVPALMTALDKYLLRDVAVINSSARASLDAVRAADKNITMSLFVNPFGSSMAAGYNYALADGNTMLGYFYTQSSHTWSEFIADSTVAGYIANCIQNGIVMWAGIESDDSHVADLISMGFSGVHTMEERSATTLT